MCIKEIRKEDLGGEQGVVSSSLEFTEEMSELYFGKSVILIVKNFGCGHPEQRQQYPYVKSHRVMNRSNWKLPKSNAKSCRSVIMH